MKANYIVGLTLAVMAAASCEKGNEIVPVVDDKTYEFGQTVRNLDYTEEVVLEGLGETTLESADNLPSWVGGVTLRETGFQGNPVALVDVKGDDRLEEEREATLVLKMGSGATVNLTLNQWPFLREKGNDAYQSVNTAFEADWASVKKITIVTSYVNTNGRPEIKVDDAVSLPWDFEGLPTHYLPKGDGRDATKEVNKMMANKGDWSLVFNLTGIKSRPNYNYFGLYNRYTGILRVFYYFTGDLIPDNSTNDHLWAFSLNADLAEHLSTQFAIPKNEPATLDIRKEAAKPVLVTPTTDSYNPLLSSGKTVPAVGWWAFDVNLAALRDHDFFQQTLQSSAIDINLCTYAKENVLLNSVLQGSINGHMQGKMNLDLIAPTSTSGWAKIVSPLLSTGSQIALNTYVIKEGFIKSTGNQNNNQVYHNEQPIIPPAGGEGGGGALPAVARPQSVAVGAIVSVAIGAVMSLAAKYIDSFAKQKVVDQDFGALTANMSLDLNAVMTTAGTIGGPTTNKVPPASMTMDYIKKTNQDGTPTCLGDGIWNLNNHPVIYVVKDAYWSENNFNSFGARKEFPLGDTDVYSYDLAATKGSRPGLRLITFLDPTSVGGLSFNNKLFDNGIDLLKVYLSYGVYPGSEPGYSDAFRKAAGLDYAHTWRLSTKDSFDSSKDLKLFKQPHTNELFKWTQMDDEIKDVAAYRLSSQKLRTDHPGLERRFYGASLYYSKPYATDFVVDEVQYVYDPQIFLPFDDAAHRIYDPMVPDLVVSAALFGYGKDKKDSEASTLTNTLRFLPRIELISYTQVEAIYNEILARKEKLNCPANTTTVWIDMKTQIEHIKDIVDALK